MNFIRLHNQLESAASTIEETTSAADDDGLIGHVIAGLRHMAANLHDFEKNIAASKVFLKSFTQNLKVLADLPNSKDQRRLSLEAQLVLVKEVAFALFEELAVFFKEKTLAEEAPAVPVESDLLAEFENNSQWGPDHDGMVCKFYYCYLPGIANGAFSLDKVRTFFADLE